VSHFATSEVQKHMYPFSVVQFITPYPLWKWFSFKTTAQINAYHSQDNLSPSVFWHERKTSVLVRFLHSFWNREAQEHSSTKLSAIPPCLLSALRKQLLLFLTKKC